jgi:hypothetical protein
MLLFICYFYPIDLLLIIKLNRGSAKRANVAKRVTVTLTPRKKMEGIGFEPIFLD